MRQVSSLKLKLRAWDAARRQRKRMRETAETDASEDYGHWVDSYDRIDDAVRAALRERCRRLASRPLISVLMPVYNPKPEWLAEAIDSVRAQIYPEWELCIADDRSTDPEVIAVLDDYVRRDPRIHVVHRAENGHISAASNSALEIARGEHVALLDHDDILPEHALLCIAETLARYPDAAIVYSDEDKIDEHGQRREPHFKCDWNLALFRAYNMVSHLGAYRTALVRDAGGFRVGYEGSQDYDLALRCVDRVRPSQIVHVPQVLYHWRIHAGSTAGAHAVKPYALEAGRRALREHLARNGVDAEVDADVTGRYAVRYRLPQPAPRVSVVLLDTGSAEDLARCLQGLAAAGLDEHERIVASTRKPSSDAAGARWLRTRGTFAARANAAAQLATGDVLLFLMSDCRLSPRSGMPALVAQALQIGVGLAGARIETDARLSGGAIVLGLRGSYGVLYRGLGVTETGYFARAVVSQDVSAVDAGCVAVVRDRFLGASGFDASLREPQAASNELSLRLRERGMRNVWVPDARVLREKKTGLQRWSQRRAAARDWARIQHNWPALTRADPAYSRNLTLVRETFGLAHPPRVSLARPWFDEV
jgi:GT2 family glycosyltransferase